MQLIDLTHIIRDRLPVYPGDEPVRLTQSRDLLAHKHVNHCLVTGMHSGTHLDGPAHLLPSRIKISDLSLEHFLGRGCLLDVRSQPVVNWRREYDDLIQSGDIVLLYTGWDQYFEDKRYFEDGPVVEQAFAEQLVEKRVKMLGLDTSSPDQSPFPVHKLLLGNGILILENLTNLGALLMAERFEVMAFPLSLWADSSPVRVVARVDD